MPRSALWLLLGVLLFPLTPVRTMLSQAAAPGSTAPTGYSSMDQERLAKRRTRDSDMPPAHHSRLIDIIKMEK